MSDDFLRMLSEIGALKRGHFLLSSGRHSDQYVEKFDLLRDPRATAEACGHMIELVGESDQFDLVVGPTTGGILLAFEIGRQLDKPAAYAERASEGSSERVFKRGTVIKAGARVLLVDDVLTTGGSVRETLTALERLGAETRQIAVLVDRSGGAVEFGAPLTALAALDIQTWPAEACPLCAEGLPLTKPGTTSLPGA